MGTWGIAVISLALLLIAYHTWYLGIPLLILGLGMFIFGRRKEKAKREADKAHKETKIKPRK